MQEVIDFLNQNRIVFMATSDQGQARVRPFQFQFVEGGRLWFCTGKRKEVFAQIQSDPRLEFSCLSSNMVTLRVMGKANLDDDMAIKRRIMEENPPIRSIYQSAENPDFTVFSVDHGSACMFGMDGKPPKTFTF